MSDPSGPLLQRFLDGELLALSRAITLVENQRPGFERLLTDLHKRLGRARRIGITGPPGAGKSTLTAGLARHYRDAGDSVAVIAVDPSSPFTGGALLGDRIRMDELATEPGIYIRSMASRGSRGGLSATSREATDLLDAFGFDRVLLETVGVGQSELEIASQADVTAVVLVPESGDGIQAMKAGLMEVADLFVVNKADRPGADRLRKDIRSVAALGEREKRVPIVMTVASRGEGVSELAESLDEVADSMEASGELARRRRAAAIEHTRAVLERAVARRAAAAWSARLEEMDDPLEGDSSPYEIVRGMVARLCPEDGAP